MTPFFRTSLFAVLVAAPIAALAPAPLTAQQPAAAAAPAAATCNVDFSQPKEFVTLYNITRAQVIQAPAGDDRAKLVKGIFKNVAVLDSGARGSTTTFVERGIGDVLISWENEAYLAVNELGKDKFDIVNPSISILAEPSVSVVDKVVDRKGTRTVANAYLAYLYTPEGQRIAAQNYYRPRTQSVFQEFASQFPAISLLTIDDFGGWDKAQKDHFSDGGTFDQIYQP